MISRIKDFNKIWLEEADSTSRVWETIPENLKSNKVHENVRTLERLAWHITTSNTEMLSMGGITLSILPEDKVTPTTLAEIIRIYKASSQEIAEAVMKQWTDDNLEDLVEMYGDTWSNGRLLYILLGHQGHHRSQMTVIMRILGLEVPGTWGPSKEEWVQYGMLAQI